MAEALKVNEPGVVKFTATSALTSGQVIQLADGRPAIAAGLQGFASGDEATAYTEGRYNFAAASGTTFAAGDPVYWDVSTDLAIPVMGAADDLYLGTAALAKTSGQTVVTVDVGVSGAGAGSSSQRGVWSSRVVEIDHADTAQFSLVTAIENPRGLMVSAFVGQVTEAPSGSSEDQLIITLYDEDDNVLSTMTTTNTTPDAIGDIVLGIGTPGGGATGQVMAIIPAGKAAYAKVSQATAGTPAGKVRVRAMVCTLD